MPATVSLRDVVNEMDVYGDESRAFVNRSTGELTTFGVEELSAVEEGSC
jgi:hypothetical protein